MRKFDFHDIILTPATESEVDSRKDIDIRVDSDIKQFKYSLPLMTSPMDTVVDTYNCWEFYEKQINTVLPRGISTDEMSGLNQFIFSISLEEAENMSKFPELFEKHKNKIFLIDIANGHMTKLHDIVRDLIVIYPNMKIIVGNVATPETYKVFADMGAFAVRLGIGNGQACTTTANVAVGYPMASLIKECYDASLYYENPPLIIADGGFKNFDDIIKAHTLGADFVMLGSIFNKALESSGNIYWKDLEIKSKWLAGKMFDRGFKLKKLYRGMSTKDVQKSWNKKELQTSEGIVKLNDVEYRLETWVENFSDYLRSAMSYSGCKNLKEFIGLQNYELITESAFRRFHK